ncbi:hypothetical protein [Sulfitobacter sp. 916]|uniref:hypothetical protein n=1 Tax=Sulfitobacter sp. 916 TaxID=3368559 RepID=UPI003749C2FC
MMIRNPYGHHFQGIADCPQGYSLMDKNAETLRPTARDKDRIKDASPTKTAPLDAHVSVDQTYTLAK